MCEECDALTIPSGLTGPKGDTGATGAQGPIGPAGLPGNNGFRGNEWFTSDSGFYPIVDHEGNPLRNGDMHLNQEGEIYEYSVTLEDWFNTGVIIKGPQGIQGIQGVQGIQGIQGIQGPQGIPGVNGFIYETIDGNTIPAEADLNNDYLRRNVTNTGYEFAKFSQLAADIQFHNNNLGFNKF